MFCKYNFTILSHRAKSRFNIHTVATAVIGLSKAQVILNRLGSPSGFCAIPHKVLVPLTGSLFPSVNIPFPYSFLALP